MNAICPNCGLLKRAVAQQIGGKITFGVAAALFGTRALKDPVITAVCVVAGLLVGHYVDQEVSKRCPQCGAILRITGLLP